MTTTFENNNEENTKIILKNYVDETKDYILKCLDAIENKIIEAEPKDPELKAAFDKRKKRQLEAQIMGVAATVGTAVTARIRGVFVIEKINGSYKKSRVSLAGEKIAQASKFFSNALTDAEIKLFEKNPDLLKNLPKVEAAIQEAIAQAAAIYRTFGEAVQTAVKSVVKNSIKALNVHGNITPQYLKAVMKDVSKPSGLAEKFSSIVSGVTSSIFGDKDSQDQGKSI